MAVADLYENDNWARKGCVWPDLPAVCCCRKLEGGDENLPYSLKKKKKKKRSWLMKH
jgi:hypothetical protein